MASKKKQLEISLKDLNDIKPITDNQKEVFNNFADKNLFLYGVAGTGKTFVALYNALKDVLDPKSPRERVYIVRSIIPTRDIGFLPGDEEDKSYLYQTPYQNMVRFMFKRGSDAEFDRLYNDLRNQGTIDFLTTSFLRGVTIDNGVIIVDECQNLNFHELDTIMTRVGQDSKIVFAGDMQQTDLTKTQDRNGILDFVNILQQMPEVNCIEFDLNDIVRSGLIKSYLINKIKLGLHYEQQI
ncbi:PhoH-like phosphate starvation-inducible [Pelagibacter phage HTVC008M]|jgi:predicted ribonuclease YlaK|uniref:PhoH-like phosphate starvation-inducible n=1 Tax=Pelagibacter phage HTVC008M TaxID=1283076 RepID=UPI0002B274F3|nr:PhoH-like phosphate starvation-inducible [Pelagibacter phage HTVC008M]AGE60525.1 PhoH [Pelagibacter phage HTVC008M]|tara:strand:+ start:2473 stop:3192 length:720 start_codon:yes stop_codon:yes gene_type:complete